MKTHDFGYYKIGERFFLREVFYWCDGPMLFTCTYAHPERGKLYLLGLALDEEQLLFITMSQKRCRNVENWVTSLRQAMLFPDGPSFAREITPRCWTSSCYFIVENFEEDFSKWQVIIKQDLINNDWVLPGGFKWHLGAKEKRVRRAQRRK